MKFFAVRYFVIKASLTLFEDDTVDEPKDYFIQPFLQERKVVYYNKEYLTVLINGGDKKRYYFGYLLKSREVSLIQLEEKSFDEQDITNYEKLFFAIDTEKQIFLCEYKTTIATPQNVRNVLYDLIGERAGINGYEIKLEFIIDEFRFWDIINEADGIYQIAFNLYAPNLFGGRKEANEWLTVLKEDYNMSEVTVDFRNNQAKLQYDQEELESYRDYADSGGGNWTLGILKGAQKKKYVSNEHLKTKEAEVPDGTPKEIREKFDAIFLQIATILNEIDPEDKRE